MENITNEKVNEFLSEKYTPYSKALMDIRLNAEENYIPIIQRDAEELLVSMLMLQKPRKILEVGSCIGYSATIMAIASSESRITTIERSVELVKTAQENLDDFGLSNRVKVILGSAEEVLPKLNARGQIFDFAFVDGAKSHYKEFCNEIIKMMPKGGVIVCDNILQRGMTVDNSFDPKGKHKTAIRNMNEFIDYMKNREDIKTHVLAVGDGVLIGHVL